MFIGQVAKKTGLSVRAIRLYEEKGLISPPKRRGCYRVYSEEDIDLLNLIVEAKKMGVTLKRLEGVIVRRDGNIDWEKIGAFLHDLRKVFEQEQTRIVNNIKRLDNCLAEIDHCAET